MRCLVGVFVLLLPGHALALSLDCIFDIECYESEGCDMSAYAMDLVIENGEAPYPVIAETDAETMSGEAFDFGDGMLIRLGSAVGAVLMSVDGEGFARQSVHFEGAAGMVNYMGACEVVE